MEMIAEVKWRLTPVTAIPNGAIDPFHDAIKAALKERFPPLGYPHHREKVPPEIPRELLAGQATTQFYKAPDVWPIYQLGPGVFTVNITEGYWGWASFRDTVAAGIEQLLAAHPALTLFQLESLKLMAIDAFSEQHGYRSYNDFSQKYLTLGELLPSSFLAQFASNTEAVNVRSDTTFPLNVPAGAHARISISDGLRSDQKALILHTAIESGPIDSIDLQNIMNWFDAAHGVHRTMFRSLLTEDLKVILQPEIIHDDHQY